MMTQSEQEVKFCNTGTILAAIEAGQQPTTQDWAAFNALPELAMDAVLSKMEAAYWLLSKAAQATYWLWKEPLNDFFQDAMRANVELAKRWF